MSRPIFSLTEKLDNRTTKKKKKIRTIPTFVKEGGSIFLWGEGGPDATILFYGYKFSWDFKLGGIAMHTHHFQLTFSTAQFHRSALTLRSSVNKFDETLTAASHSSTETIFVGILFNLCIHSLFPFKASPGRGGCKWVWPPPPLSKILPDSLNTNKMHIMQFWSFLWSVGLTLFVKC